MSHSIEDTSNGLTEVGAEVLEHASDAASHAAGHADPVVPVLVGLIVIFFAARLGAIIAKKVGQPAVLGELIAGVVVGNLTLLGFHSFDFIPHDQTIDIIARIGVIILLFEVGLETNVKEMAAVGLRSTLVALSGVITPFVLGYYMIGVIVPDIPEIAKVFTGAILTATSVGITARVFKDLNFLKSQESKIVLGAAVIDDILGLIILAIVAGVAVTGSIEASTIIGISTKAVLFVVLSLAAGILLARRTFKLLAFFELPGMMLISALVFCFGFAVLANMAGLATIVGAFAAGLVLEEFHFKPFEAKRSIEEYIHPISLVVVPVFFVLTGMAVDLSVFADTSIVTASLAISAVAIVGKLVCGWSFTADEPINRAVIGAGMIPRGEVGLIFATVGKSIGVVDDRLYAITVIMVILTTIVAPPVIGFLIQQSKKKK